MTEYKQLNAACRLVATCRYAIYQEENVSPAWRQIDRVYDYLSKQMVEAFEAIKGTK